ncbi:MAG: cohesin domain-containing protein [Gemmatimonadota bacterium]|nr:cohesin domain-containing protein [Gemmatimonadota bacterium]
MHFRRFMGPVLAIQIVATFVRVAWPQEVADTKGIAIRVDKPAAGAWAGINDAIEIRILTFDGILDGGFRVSVVDEPLDDDDVGAVAGGTAAGDGFVYFNIYVPVPDNPPVGVEFGDGEASGVDTFRVSITVSPQATAFQSKNSHAVKVVVDLDAASSGNELNNLMTNRKITPASSGFGASRVGDGVGFGIDANRPVHEGVFRSFSIATDDLNVDTTAAGLIERVRIGIGDEITVRLGLNTGNVINAGAYGVRVGIVEEDSAFSTAPVSFEFLGDRLFSVNLRESKQLEEGDYSDNRRVRVEAFLVDAAGNLGGVTMDAQAASAVSAGHGLPDVFDPDGVEWIVDATSPVITIVHPHPDSMEGRISAAVTQTLSDYLHLPEEARRVQTNRRLNPLEFKLSEVPDSIRISHGDSTYGIGSGAIDDPGTADVDEDMAPTGGDSTATLGLPWNYDVAGGVRKDLKIEVWDSLGNSSSIELKGIWYDEKAPVIGDLFPSAAAAPRDADNNNEPTINLATRDPVFTIDEELDSLSVRYVEHGRGATAIEQGFGRGNPRLKTIGELVNWPVRKPGFIERNRYDLQILAFDLAGNASVTGGGTLTFTRGFLNPSADVFKVAAAPNQADSVVAGQQFSVRITALDTMLTRIEETDVHAVTYQRVAELAVIVSGDQAGALAGLSFSGPGVSDAPDFPLPPELVAAGMAAKAAVLDGDGWNAGQRDVRFRSTSPLRDVAVMAVERFADPVTGGRYPRVVGQLDGAVDVGVSEFSRFTVTAIENGVSSGSVAGAFTVRVVPTDKFGNPSMKIDPTPDSGSYESVAVAFASSNGAVTVPFGRQEVAPGGTEFGAVAANPDGSARVSVWTIREDFITDTDDDFATADGTDPDDTTGALRGSVEVTLTPEGGPGTVPGAPAAPASIEVVDYLGADGQGDHGGQVIVSFPKPARHVGVIHYLIEREIETTLEGHDEDGNEVHSDEPMKKWMHWAAVGPGSGSGDAAADSSGNVRRAVIPALDNTATNWGVRSVGSAGGSAVAPHGIRVFSRESVRHALRLLGLPHETVLTDAELMDRLNAPGESAESVMGDRKDLVFVPVNPGVGARAGSASVPVNIRSATGGGLLVSARTVTEAPVGAVDNIAPDAVTDATGEGAGGVVLRWTGSGDDRIVHAIPFRGFNVPIPGVRGYRVMRGATAGDLEEIAALPPGSTEFTDERPPDGISPLVYRIDAFDDNNDTPGQLITIQYRSARARFADANGDPVYLVVLPPAGDLEMNFEDFIAFAAAFGSRKGDGNYNVQADVNDDGAVDFSDFVTAAATFGRVAVASAAGKPSVSPRRRGMNADAVMTLELSEEKVRVGETISVKVSMDNVSALNGYGLELVYDADKFEFVSVVPAKDDLLKSGGGETPLFGNWPEAGRIPVVNAIIESGSVSGGGALVVFTFKVLRGFEEIARFEIARGVVFDAEQLRNTAVSLGALDVRGTPTEFALHQNYPNPFNPRTSIRYDLAEGGDVLLRIYNLLGQEVRTLVRERQRAGRYTAQWSGNDNRGVPVSSGVYFYQVTVTGGYQDARRLILIR